MVLDAKGNVRDDYVRHQLGSSFRYDSELRNAYFRYYSAFSLEPLHSSWLPLGSSFRVSTAKNKPCSRLLGFSSSYIYQLCDSEQHTISLCLGFLICKMEQYSIWFTVILPALNGLMSRSAQNTTDQEVIQCLLLLFFI